MKKALTLLFIGVSMAIPAIGQSEIDTLYYDKDWKGVENKAFATYFRIIPTSTDSNFRKQFRDYYITGELQSEGGFIIIDRYDDSKSIFDGQWTNYYKSGKVEQKGNRINGKQEGEYTKYKEDGLVSIHANFRNDKLHGIYTEFSEDGNLCIQVEYSNGEPLYDYYVVSNKDGFCSKMRLSDNQPIYETPSLNEKEVEYKDGDLVNVFDNLGFNKMLPFDLRTGKITDDALESASEKAKQIKDQYKVHKKKSMSEKVEMYLQKIFSAYKEVGKGITIKELCKFIQDILNTASGILKSLFSSKGYKYYDRVTESEELDFDDVIKQLKKLIKKYTK